MLSGWSGRVAHCLLAGKRVKKSKRSGDIGRYRGKPGRKFRGSGPPDTTASRLFGWILREHVSYASDTPDGGRWR
jgi:hypothetical protein